MKTIGKVLKSARITKKISIEDLSKETKIKKNFIRALEKEKWNELPEYPVVSGFTSRLGGCLGLKKQNVIAILRRDYPPQSVSLNPKPDVSDRFVWTPKLTFITGTVLVFLTVVGYLVFQYLNYIRPPKLVIISPTDGQIVSSQELQIAGNTSPEVSIRANSQSILVDASGNFNGILEIDETVQQVEIKAQSKYGRETIIIRNITVQPQ